MKTICRLLTWACALGLALSTSLMVPQANAEILPDLVVDNYQSISKQGKGAKKGRGLYEYTLTADLINRGSNGYSQVTATVASNSPNTQILDGTLTFGRVPPDTVVTSSDSFSLIHDRRFPFRPADLIWTVSGDLAAAQPPPPVSQRIGMDDTTANHLPPRTCRGCHDGHPELHPGLDMAEIHHLQISQPIPPDSEIPYPDPTVFTYGCFSCHRLTDGQLVPHHDSDCLSCHAQTSAQSPSRHHLAHTAQDRNCTRCHGMGVVNDLDDGHYIPWYISSLVTPWASGKDINQDGIPDTGADVNGDGIADMSSAGTYAGNCDFCHNTESGTPGSPTIDPVSGVIVFTNFETHHTALGSDSSQITPQCYWCHSMEPNQPPSRRPYEIRFCENCHGIASIHNIQLDSDGDNVIHPGRERPYYGHIGNQADCLGCHAFSLLLSQSLPAAARDSGTVNTSRLGPMARTQGVTAASVPPPPVSQNLGMLDTTQALLTETECRFCHNSNPESVVVNPTYLPDRHHLQVGRTIPAASEVPFPDADGDSLADVTYGCLNCHSLTFIGSWQISANFRDCRWCHIRAEGQGSIHHRTAPAQNGDCKRCHGDYVSNMNDGHDIPTYIPSLVMPWPSGKLNGGVPGEGNCTFCHAGGITPAGMNVQDNASTHHFALGTDSTKCIWCHNPALGGSDEYSIRTCENCHSVVSLHNIRADSNADGMFLPGGENPFFSHIGHEQDCRGCHGFLPEPITDQTSNPDRHHILAEGRYTCFSCHSILFDPGTLSYRLGAFRDCTLCHVTTPVFSGKTAGNSQTR